MLKWACMGIKVNVMRFTQMLHACFILDLCCRVFRIHARLLAALQWLSPVWFIIRVCCNALLMYVASAARTVHAPRCEEALVDAIGNRQTESPQLQQENIAQ